MTGRGTTYAEEVREVWRCRHPQHQTRECWGSEHATTEELRTEARTHAATCSCWKHWVVGEGLGT